MIKPVGSYADCREFAEGFQGDPDFSDPMLSTGEQIRCNLEKAFTRPNRQILGACGHRPLGKYFHVDQYNIRVGGTPARITETID